MRPGAGNPTRTGRAADAIVRPRQSNSTAFMTVLPLSSPTSNATRERLSFTRSA